MRAKLISSILRMIFNHPKKVILNCCLFTIFMGIGSFFLVVNDDMMTLLPEEIDSRKSWNSVQEEFGSTQIIFIAFGNNSNIYNEELLADCWDITNALIKEPEVHKVTSISTQNQIKDDNGFLIVEKLQPSRNLSRSKIDNIKKYLGNNLDVKSRLTSINQDYLNIIVKPKDNIPHDKMTDKVVSISNRILKGKNVYFGGTAYITGSMPSIIRDDISFLIIIGLLIMSVILFINLRDLSAVGLVFSVIIQSLIVMIGFMGWMTYLFESVRFHFSILNTSMPIILLTIANSDSVHIITKFLKEYRLSRNKKLSVKNTVSELFIPILLTSITTIVAFLALGFAPIEQMLGYGLSVSIGILWAFILSICFLPAILYQKRWDEKSKAICEVSLLEKSMKNLSEFVFKSPKKILSLSCLIIIISLFGLTKLGVDVNIANFFQPGSDFRNGIDFMDQNMSGTMDLRVRIEGDIREPDLLNDISKVQDKIYENNKITQTYSISNVLEKMHRAFMGDSIKYETIPDSKNKVGNLISMYSLSSDINDLSELVNQDFSSSLITAMSRVMTTSEIIDFVDGVDDFIKSKTSIINYSVTGMAVIMRDLVYLIIQSSLISISLSIILIGILTFVFFKNIYLSIFSVIPLLLAVLLNFGFMGLFNIQLNHITAILSSIIIGVGVDFAIHYISRFIELNNKSKLVSSGKIINEVGYPIVLDSLSNMAFGALLFSTFIPVQYIGALMVFAMASTSVLTLTLLAILIDMAKNKII